MSDSHEIERYRRLLTESNLPSELHGKNFALYKAIENEPTQQAVRSAIMRYAEKFHKPMKAKAEEGSFLPTQLVAPKSLLFVGDNGTGKTFLAGCLANELMYHKGICLTYSSMDDIVQEMKAANDYKTGDTTQGVYKNYLSPELLILDELGASDSADSSLEGIVATKIFNDRLANHKPTLLISNLSIPELSNYMGRRFGDRLKLCAACQFTWDSLRR